MRTRILTAARGSTAALAGGLLMAVAGLGLGVLPAAAHASLIASTPDDGATVNQAPTEVVLEFDDDILAEFTQVAVLDADDGNHEQGEPETSGARVTQAVGPLDPGEYRVSYRVGSADGHPVSGVITFTVAEAPAEAGQTETRGPTDTATEPAAEQAASTPTPEPAAAATDGGEAPLWISGAAAAVAAAAVAAFVLTRRRRGGSDPT